MALLKTVIKNKFEVYMEQRSVTQPDKFNWELWETEKLTAKEKKILIAHIVGEAWLEVCSPKYKRIRTSAFTKTGLAMTLTGSNDNTVICEGMRFPVELVPAGQVFDDKEYLAQAWSLDENFYKGKGAAAAALGAGPAHAANEDAHAAALAAGPAIEDGPSSDEQGLNSSDDDEQGENSCSSSDSVSLDGSIAEVMDDDMMLADLILGGPPVPEDPYDEENLFGSDSD